MGAMSARRYLVAAFGDAGHAFPAIALARALGYDWRDRAQPFTRVHELALKGYAKGVITLGTLADLFDQPKEDMYERLRAWGVRQEFEPSDALVGSAS